MLGPVTAFGIPYCRYGVIGLRVQASKGASKEQEDLDALFTVDTKGHRPQLGRCQDS